MQKKWWLFMGFPLLALGGCLEDVAYPDEPEIWFVSLTPSTTVPDDAVLTLGFTDGDGDLGLDQEDLDAMPEEDSLFYNNVFIDYFELENGEWIALPPAVPYYYRIPRISPSGQNKALRGELLVDILAYYNPFTENDTFRYEISVVDRARRYSNRLTTPEFVKP